jgi:hypothetical protein
MKVRHTFKNGGASAAFPDPTGGLTCALAQALAEGIAEADGPAVLLEEIAESLVAQVDEVLAEVAPQQLDGLHDDTIEDNAFCGHGWALD